MGLREKADKHFGINNGNYDENPPDLPLKGSIRT